MRRSSRLAPAASRSGKFSATTRDLISDLLSSADTETARDLANTLLLNQGFEELTKKSLLARFIKLFPSLQTLVAGESETKDDQLLVSRSSYERRRIEYEEIVSKRIPDNSKAIATAREHGDLKENSEFKMAKQDQAVLMGHKALLERDLARARITDFLEATTDHGLHVGTIVDLRDVSNGKGGPLLRARRMGQRSGQPSSSPTRPRSARR